LGTRVADRARRFGPALIQDKATRRRKRKINLSQLELP
jgi:hypothetical protein